MGSRTDVFRQLVRDHMRRGIATVPEGATCGDAVSALRDHGPRTSSVVVTAADGTALGIVTERDIARRVVFQRGPETPVDEVMSRPVLTIREDDFLFHGIAVMRRNNLRHLPVVGAAGGVAGILDLHAVLAVASREMVGQIDRLTHEETIEGMKEVKATQVSVADELFRDNVPAPEIQALLSHVDRDLFARLTRLCVREMAADGRGEAPLAFSVIVMGSVGRGECYVYPDQDFGLIVEDYPDTAHDRIDRWFVELGVRLADALDAVGFPYCKGGVMASNPLWRKSLAQWREQIDIWIRRSNPTFIRLADIFFDFVPVHGAEDLAGALRDHITRRLKGNHAFLRAMFGLEERKVALGLFNRFITERNVPGHIGEINLKFTGTLPLVEATRILALREGIAETSTLGRIARLHAAGVLDDDEEDYLRGAFRLMTELLLRRQIADFRNGRKVNNYVHPDSLSEREKDMLIDSFKAITALLDRIRSELTGKIF